MQERSYHVIHCMNMHGDSRFIYSTLLLNVYLQCLIVTEQWPCPPGSTLHVTQMQNQELFCSLRYACLPCMCVLILRASSVRKTCAPVRARAVCFGLHTYTNDTKISTK